MLANISPVSSSRSSSRAEILLQFDGKYSGKFHCAEYVIETTGRPDKKCKKMLHVVLTEKHSCAQIQCIFHIEVNMSKPKFYLF